jgi:hypothetical protein
VSRDGDRTPERGVVVVGGWMGISTSWVRFVSGGLVAQHFWCRFDGKGPPGRRHQRMSISHANLVAGRSAAACTPSCGSAHCDVCREFPSPQAWLNVCSVVLIIREGRRKNRGNVCLALINIGLYCFCFIVMNYGRHSSNN